LCEQALAELCQLLFQVLLALFRGLALVGALLRDRCLVMLELPLRLLQVLAQCGYFRDAVDQALFEPELFAAQTDQGDFLPLHGFFQPLAACLGGGQRLTLLRLCVE